MLTPEGRAFARRIGEAFARQLIKPTVITSPMCRCRETAHIAFGEVMRTDPGLREVATADSRRTAEFERMAQSLIAKHRGASLGIKGGVKGVSDDYPVRIKKFVADPFDCALWHTRRR